MPPAWRCSVAAFCSGMLAVSYLAETNAHTWSPTFVIPLAIAMVALWMFFRHINRSTHPFIAPHLISGPGFGTVNLINGLYGGVTSGVVALIPLYASNRYGIDALGSGTLLDRPRRRSDHIFDRGRLRLAAHGLSGAACMSAAP